MKPKIKEIIWGAFSTALIATGFSIHSWYSLCLLILGSICASVTLFYRLLNHKTHSIKRSQARKWGLMLLAVLLIGSILCWRQHKQPSPGPEPKSPQLTLVLNTSDSPQAGLRFTNDFLFPKKGMEHLPFLIVWVPRGHTNVILRFGLSNGVPHPFDAADDVEFTVDDALIELVMIKRQKSKPTWNPDPLWEQGDLPKVGGGKSLIFRFPQSILPGLDENAPGISFDVAENQGITFDTTKDLSEVIHIGAVIRAKRLAPVVLGCKLIFLRSDSGLDPCFDTDSDFQFKVIRISNQETTN